MSEHAAPEVRRLSLLLAVVLTLGTGSMDAIGFARLGDVFTSVMTGNLVLLGLSAGAHNGTLARHILLALATFTVGVVTAGLITKRSSGAGQVWPRCVTHTLVLQLVVIVVFFVGWQAAHGHPHGGGQLALLALAALAMGLQSGAVVGIGLPGLSTTYVTGTLTQLITTAAQTRRLKVESAAILIALVVGACIAGVLILHAPRFAPVLPLCAVGAVVAIAWRSPVLRHAER